MRAIARSEYGPPDVVEVREVPKPVPRNDEVLVEVRAASVNRSDWESLVGEPFYTRMNGLRRPRRQILGSDVAGVVEAVGKDHVDFRAGDEVFGEMETYSDGFAEYVCTRGKTWALKPAEMSFEVAASIPQAGVIALQGIRDRVQPGQSVLINGAGGGTGLFAVQLAKAQGAEVTGVDNAGKLDFMRSIGADHVIDYAREDFTRTGRQHDLVLDVIANRSPWDCARALRPGGTYRAAGGSVATFLGILVLGPWLRQIRNKNVRILVVRRNRQDLVHVTELCRAGKLVPIVDRTYPLSDAAQALRHLGEGHVKGKVVITMDQRSRA